MMGGPWFTRLALVLFIIMVHRASINLALVMVLGAGAAALGIYLFERRLLPRVIMDVLERLTDKNSLETAYAERSTEIETIDAADLIRRVKAKVIGQDAAITRMVEQLRRRMAARRPDKPIAVFCLAGAPGVGKTHFAKTLAAELYGNKKHLHFFDMAQFAQPHSASSLFGSAKGYVGSTSYGSLTAALRDTPNAVVLLDEFEKADTEIHKRFLTAWNDGFVTEVSNGARVPTSEAVFILTTNAASRKIGEFARQLESDQDELTRSIKSTLQDSGFVPELLSRIDDIFAFKPLAGLDIARVVALEIETAARQYGLEIEAGGIEPSILMDAVEQLSGQMAGGVRDVSRAIEREVSDGLIDARTAGAASIKLVNDGEHLRVIPVRMKQTGGAAPVQQTPSAA